MSERLAPRLEDYLESIYILEKEKGVARVKDIARLRNVKMPTVTEVLKRLAERGYIDYEPYGFIKVTSKGKSYAEKLLAKHDVLTRFMKDILMLPEEFAEREGCLMEHHLSNETIRRLNILISYLMGSGILDRFRKHIKGKTS